MRKINIVFSVSLEKGDAFRALLKEHSIEILQEYPSEHNYYLRFDCNLDSDGITWPSVIWKAREHDIIANRLRHLEANDD